MGILVSKSDERAQKKKFSSIEQKTNFSHFVSLNDLSCINRESNRGTESGQCDQPDTSVQAN